jgi:hypothetical protein
VLKNMKMPPPASLKKFLREIPGVDLLSAIPRFANTFSSMIISLRSFLLKLSELRQ